MKRIISIGLLVGGILFGQNSYSKIKEKIHFKMGMGTAVTYVTGPETLKAGNNNQLVLQREGTPVFFASAPDGKAGGSMLFTTDNGYYHSDDIQVDPTDNFVFEVWAKALITDRKDMDAKHTFGIVSIGDRNHGYNIVQQGDKWFALVGGVKMFEIGNVIYNRWTHLALVADGEKCTLWLNGEKGGAFRRTSQINPGFTVGNLSRGNNQFSGEVYEVRYATFNEGTFNPAQDFLLNYKQIKAQKKQLATAQKIRISKIVKPGFGCVLTDAYRETAVEEDYLIREVDNPSQLFISKDANEMSAQMVLTNGLVSRVFYVSENLACISYKNLLNDAQYLRAVKPEARIKIDDRWIDVGGLTGQPEKSYLLNQWIPEMEANPNAWLLSGISTEKPKARYLWKEKYNARETEWPPKGLHLILHFEAPESEIELKGVNVDVHYELYDGIPVMAKWLTIDNRSGKDFVVEKTECEVLAVTEDQVDRIHVESDYSFALANANPLGSALIHYDKELKPYQAGQTTTSWMVDPEYNTWATHNQAEDGFLKYPHRNLLKSRLPMGPSELVKNGNAFQSFITFELLLDSDDKERNSLAHRRMYRTLAPQVTESLLGAAITSHDERELKSLIDQMHELGMEELTIAPWPGIRYDNTNEEYLSHWGTIGRYAKERGIIMAGYELQIASRSRGAKVDCIDPSTGKPGSRFGQSVCIASEWRDDYFPKMWKFYDRSGFMMYSADGPYHGDACASKVHKYHRGLEDSQWEQWKEQVDIIHEAQQRGMYVGLPDWYFLNGSCSTGMGYREASANLTPQQQLLLGRQYIYDGTWHKIPTMGHMTLQLVGFYTNDPRVGLEPLKDNLDRYERGLVQYLSSGCQFTIRGNRLYDTPETKSMVKKWIDWFSNYREVLTGDIIHLGRPNGRDLDCMMHVNPFGKDKGMVIIFNPTDKKIRKELTLPMYYTGLDKEATISEKGETPKKYLLDRQYNVNIDVTVEANGYTWFLIK